MPVSSWIWRGTATTDLFTCSLKVNRSGINTRSWHSIFFVLRDCLQKWSENHMTSQKIISQVKSPLMRPPWKWKGETPWRQSSWEHQHVFFLGWRSGSIGTASDSRAKGPRFESRHTDSESAQHFWLGKTLTIFAFAPDKVRTSGFWIYIKSNARSIEPPHHPVFPWKIPSWSYLSNSTLYCSFMSLHFSLGESPAGLTVVALDHEYLQRQKHAMVIIGHIHTCTPSPKPTHWWWWLTSLTPKWYWWGFKIPGSGGKWRKEDWGGEGGRKTVPQ